MSKQRVTNVIIDFEFLLELEQQILQNNIRKYLLKQGQNLKVNQYKESIEISVSWFQYSYEGEFMSKGKNQKFKFPYKDEGKNLNMKKMISTMRINEQSWFITDQNNDGYHYKIILNEIMYRHDGSYSSRLLILQQNRQIGIKLFQQQKFNQAMSLYKKSINLSSGISKKQSLEQKQNLNECYIKAITNYLKCVFKLKDIENDVLQLANQYCSKLVQIQPNSAISYYLQAKLLFHKKYLSNALQSAKLANSKQQNSQCKKLIEKIQQTIQKVHSKNK